MVCVFLGLLGFVLCAKLDNKYLPPSASRTSSAPAFGARTAGSAFVQPHHPTSQFPHTVGHPSTHPQHLAAPHHPTVPAGHLLAQPRHATSSAAHHILHPHPPVQPRPLVNSAAHLTPHPQPFAQPRQLGSPAVHHIPHAQHLPASHHPVGLVSQPFAHPRHLTAPAVHPQGQFRHHVSPHPAGPLGHPIPQTLAFRKGPGSHAAPKSAGGGVPNHIPILKYESTNDGYGNYRFEYETANGIRAQEEGQHGNNETEDAVLSVAGSYSYPAPDGSHITVHYVADENGFRPSGDHLPTPPPIPEEIQRSLERNEAESLERSQSQTAGYQQSGYRY